MPDIMGYREILQSDIFSYRSVKNELEKYDTGREKGLPVENADLAVDSVILKMIEENQMNTDPVSLRENFNDVLNKFSKIFGTIKQFMISFGQNLTRRQQIYDDFEKVHPTKLVQFHKAPLWYQFLVEIASAGGILRTSDLIEMYPERHQRLINLSQDHGFVKYERGGEIIRLREDVCREVLFREYATPTTPAETRNKEYFQKTILKTLDVCSISNRDNQLREIEKFKEELMSTDIKGHVTLDWIAPLIRSNIKSIDDFITTPTRDVCRIVSSSISEVSRTVLSVVCFFKRDVKNIDIEVFDRGIFKPLGKETPDNLTSSLLKNNINNWGDLMSSDISKIKGFGHSSRVNYYRLLSFCLWFQKLVADGGGFYYKAIVDDFPYHANLKSKELNDIAKMTNKDPQDYLNIDDRDKVSAFKKSDLRRTDLSGDNIV